ncbi:MAG: hypothetical protein WBE13_13025 [Candidatus Acidiferrum sp.]
MKRIRSRAVVSSLTIVGMALAFVLFVRATGAQGPAQRIPLISDWSHRHVVFSQPHNIQEAWRLQREPRYWLQILGRSGRRNAETGADLANGDETYLDFERRRREREPAFRRDWGQSLGAAGSTGVPLSGGSWWPVFPAKFSFNLNAAPSCTNDYAVFPTNLAGAEAGQASIIAFNELYAGTGTSYCGVTNPSVYWSYDTNFDAGGVATTGTVQTSPVLSLDGSKLAFVETRAVAGGGAILHLLKWHAGDGGAINTAAAPTIATNWTADGLSSDCPLTGACMISIVLHGPQSDTASSPFYDYQRDVIYVGDDNGVLHKIINAFGLSGATPSELLTGNWPITVDKSTMLTSPVLDSVSGNIFTDDSSARLYYVRETFSTAGTCTSGSPPCLGATSVSSPAVHVVTDAPMVDSSTGKVFVFYGNDEEPTVAAAVVQSDITLSASVLATLGAGTGHHIHLGAFDNAYLTGNGSAGRLYVCGSSSNSTPTIQRIGFSNSGGPFANPVGTMNSAVDAAELAVATASAECSPVTELFNANAPSTSQDQIFFGVQNRGSGANCAGGGCVMSINITNIPATLSIANSIAETNGPSGIILDNDANTTTYPQASSLYFSRQANSTASVPCGTVVGVGCAVKVTQAGLN